MSEPLDVSLSAGGVIHLEFDSTSGSALPDDLEPIVYSAGLGVATWDSCVKGYAKRQVRDSGCVIGPLSVMQNRRRA